jgi:hypothetical protein
MFVGVTGCNTDTASGGNSILGITLTDGDGNPIAIEKFEAEEEDGLVILTVAAGQDVSALIPELKLSSGASAVSSNSEPTYDFTRPVNFLIEAEDGSTRTWTVKVKDLGSENAITGIDLVKSDGSSIWKSGETVFDEAEKQVTVTVPSNTLLTGITPILTVSPGAKVTTEIPAAGLDFTGPQAFTVVAQNGNVQRWTVAVKRDGSSVLDVNVALAGDYKVRFGFSYPNYNDYDNSAADYTPYSYEEGTPIKLSYFVTDNAIYNSNGIRRTYHNTLVVSAGGFENVEWRIDGFDAPGNNRTEPGTPPSTPIVNNILTIRAQDWSLENTHTVVFIGTRDGFEYSGTFTFKVVEQEGEEVTE